jgi:hypothetical protein
MDSASPTPRKWIGPPGLLTARQYLYGRENEFSPEFIQGITAQEAYK